MNLPYCELSRVLQRSKLCDAVLQLPVVLFISGQSTNSCVVACCASIATCARTTERKEYELLQVQLGKAHEGAKGRGTGTKRQFTV
jgi:hypothetical protein